MSTDFDGSCYAQLLCDLCDSAAHTYCVGLGREVPDGDWYCRSCSGESDASSTGSEDSVDADTLGADGGGESSGGGSDLDDAREQKLPAGEDSEGEFSLNVHFDAGGPHANEAPRARPLRSSRRLSGAQPEGRQRSSRDGVALRRGRARPRRRARRSTAPSPDGRRTMPTSQRDSGGRGGRAGGRAIGAASRYGQQGQGLARTLQVGKRCFNLSGETVSVKRRISGGVAARLAVGTALHTH